MMPDFDRTAHVANDLERDGYAVVQDFLDSTATTLLANECRGLHVSAQLEPAAIGRGRRRHIDGAVRGDSTRWFDADVLSAVQTIYWSRMDALRQSLNRELLLGLDEFEAHYALYPAGACYARHRDRFSDDDARVLSSVLYLNSNWCAADGGALRLHLSVNQNASYRDLNPIGGTLVLFLSADFEHEVLPATRERLSIAGWFRRHSMR